MHGWRDGSALQCLGFVPLSPTPLTYLMLFSGKTNKTKKQEWVDPYLRVVRFLS